MGCHALLQGSSRPRDWTRVSHVSCIGRQGGAYTCNRILAFKKSEIGPFAAAWMDLAIVELNEVGQIEREVLYNISYMQNLKKKRYKWTCLQSRNKLTDLVMQKSHTGKFEDTNERSLIHTASSNQSPILIFTPLNLSALACWAHSVPNIARDPGKNSPHPQRESPNNKRKK